MGNHNNKSQSALPDWTPLVVGLDEWKASFEMGFEALKRTRSFVDKQRAKDQNTSPMEVARG